MKKYSFTCTCGDKMGVEAMDAEEAKTKFAEMMTEEAVTAHFTEKHPGETMPAYADLMAGATLVEEATEEVAQS